MKGRVAAQEPFKAVEVTSQVSGLEQSKDNTEVKLIVELRLLPEAHMTCAQTQSYSPLKGPENLHEGPPPFISYQQELFPFALNFDKTARLTYTSERSWIIYL